jgi:hypothetical protein
MDIYSVQFILCDLAGNCQSSSGDLFLVEICSIEFDGPGKFTVNKAVSMLDNFLKKHTSEILGKDLFIFDVQVTEVGRPDTVEVSLSTLTRQKYCRQV